jgi:enoyl-CoA hydratase/carnithine racemase
VQRLQTERNDGVCILKLNRGTTNAINQKLVTTLAETLGTMREDPGVQAVVLSSHNEKFFSIGFDIPELLGLVRSDFASFYRSFNRLCIDLYTFPKPTVAGIRGHAVAGGCILAICCDYRIIAEGRKLMGLNEIKLGVPVPYPAHLIVRELVGPRNARDLFDTGDFFEAERLLQIGMVDEVLTLAQVLPRATAKARSLGESPRGASEMMKRNRVEFIESRILERLAEKEEFFIECWYSEPVRKRLREAMRKF